MRIKCFAIWCVVLCLMSNFMSITICAQQAEQNEIPTVKELMRMDLREPCGLTVEQLEKGIHGKLKMLSDYFISAEEEYGVNAVYLASISAMESGWGEYTHAHNNIFGFYTDEYFHKKSDCIDYVTQKIRIWYLEDPEDYGLDYWDLYDYTNGNMDEVGQYFNGYTIVDLGVRYNPDNKNYGRDISNIAYEVYYRALDGDEE